MTLQKRHQSCQTFLKKILTIYLCDIYLNYKSLCKSWYSHFSGPVCVCPFHLPGEQGRGVWWSLQSAALWRAPVNLLRTAVRTGIRLKLAGGRGWAGTRLQTTGQILFSCYYREFTSRAAAVRLGSLASAIINPPCCLDMRGWRRWSPRISLTLWCGFLRV